MNSHALQHPTTSLTVALEGSDVEWLDQNPAAREILLAAGKSAAISSATVEVDPTLLSRILGRAVTPADLKRARAIVEGYADQIAAAARGLRSLSISIDRLRRLASTDVQLVRRSTRTWAGTAAAVQSFA